MIEETAYFLAERRGFAAGDPDEDWLEAEKEVDQRLGYSNQNQREKELVAYQKMREEVMRTLAAVRDSITPDIIKQALEKGAKELKEIGGFTAGTITSATEAVKREIVTTAEMLGPKWETFSESTAHLFEVWRERGSEFLGQASGAVSAWIKQTRIKKKGAPRRAGEMAQPGTFECTSCGHPILLEKPDYLPACPNCNQGEFRQV